MSKGKRNRHRTASGRRPNRHQQRHLHSVPGHGHNSQPDVGPEDLELFQGLRSALRSDGPADILSVVGTLLDLTDPRNEDPSDPDDGDALATRATLVESFCTVSYAETTAALTVLQHLLAADDPLREVVAAELPRRRHPLPLWLRDLGDARASSTVWRMTHELGDGDDYVFGVSLPTGEEVTALVYVDHNMRTIVKDAFVVPQPLDAVLERMRDLLDDDQTLEPYDAATARAVVVDAIERGVSLAPDLQSETWPVCRPVVEWMVGLLPAGGQTPEPLLWTPADVDALEQEFFVSADGQELDDPDGRDLVRMLLHFGLTDAGNDPLRWSPVNVEIFLVHWVPRVAGFESGWIDELPDVLRAFIRFAHQKRGVRPALTSETLAAVDQWEPEFERLMDERLDDVEELLGFDPADPGSLLAATLGRAVGGRDVLMELDTTPLPDEPFRWHRVPEDIHPRVGEILELCDAVADAHLDVEHRTAMRRLLARAAEADPAIFRRRSSASRGAAAVAWLVCRANNTVGGQVGASIETREMLGWFGIDKGSVSDRAAPLLRAIDAPSDQSPTFGVELGTPDLLISERRRQLVEDRDYYLSLGT